MANWSKYKKQFRGYALYSEEIFKKMGVTDLKAMEKVGVAAGSGAGAAVGAGLAILATVIIVCGGLVAILKDNALQDWIERSRFGTLQGQRYNNLTTERSEFEKVFSR